MALSGESLSSVSTTGPGTAIMFDEPRTIIAQVTLTSAGLFSLIFEGTLDGVNWAQFQVFSTSTPGSYLMSNTTQPVMGVRANVTAIGGSAVGSVFFSASEF